MEFLKSNRRFSFKLGGKNAFETDYSVEATENGNELVTVYSFDGGLKVTNIAKRYANGAYEWVNYFENTADKPTYVISDLWDCDVKLPLEHEENRKWTAYLPDVKTATKVYAPTGSVWSAKEFHCDIDVALDNYRPNHIEVGMTRKYSNIGGRSSDGKAPFFNVFKNNNGYIFAIGWSGQWNSEISRTNDSIVFKSKIEDTEFCLLPGERFRTSSVIILPYQGADFVESQNLWRSFVKTELSPMGKDGRDKYGPLCAGIWGGMKASSVMERIEKIKQNNLPFEYVWMDAGWYGADTKPTPDEFEGDWAFHTGDWQVSPLIHPDKLRETSKAIHEAGMKFLLWFEPERVVKAAPIATEHPEYLLDCGNPDEMSLLLNLGNQEAWQYCFNTLSALIGELNIDCYRCDFNFSPLAYWRLNDTDGRRGITEIKYINGLYALWDALLEKFPNLIIDDCASGGRRIDCEMLKRSIPLWRTDFMCPANYDIDAVQGHTQSFSAWMPYSGTGTGRAYDEYRFRSAYSPAMTTNYSFSERDSYCNTAEKTEFIKKYTEEYLRVRPYFTEDFYPLTEHCETLDCWCASQYDRPEARDGLIQVFRRENSPYETAVLRLRAVDSAADYLFTDLDGGEFTVSGKELAEKGLTLTVTEQRKAKLYIYKAV